MKLVEIKDIRVGQVLERDRCIFVIEERTGVHNFAVTLYCHNHKPAPNDAYEALATRERNAATFEDCEIIGKIGITHRVEGNRLIEIPRREFEVDDIFCRYRDNPQIIIEVSGINSLTGYSPKEKMLISHIANICYKIGILGITHELVNDKEAPDLLANQDNEVERLREENATLNKVFETDFDVLICDVTNVKQKDQTIEQLRQLLKECLPYINNSIDAQMGVGHWPELENDLLAKINEVLG